MEGRTDTPTNEFGPSPIVLFYLSSSQLSTRPSRTLTDIPQNTLPPYMAVRQQASHWFTSPSGALTDIPQNTLPLYMAVQQQIASHWFTRLSGALTDIPQNPPPLYTAIQQQIASPWSKLPMTSPCKGNGPLHLQVPAGHRRYLRTSESLR